MNLISAKALKKKGVKLFETSLILSTINIFSKI